MPEVQKLCCNCEHFNFDFAVERDKATGEKTAALTFRCEKSRFDVKGRAIGHPQFLMYMYMGQKCSEFTVLDFTGPKGRAGLPSGESFGAGGSIAVGPTPSEIAQTPELWK